MDDLDRMLRRLMQNIRTEYPEYLSRPFEVAELYQNIIPYRHNRRDLDIETNQDYELALCRLLAGERGYLLGDASMQETMRRELSIPNPNTAIFREFAATRVALTPEAGRRYEQMLAGVTAPDDVRTVTSAPPPPPARPAVAPPPPPAYRPPVRDELAATVMAAPPPPPPTIGFPSPSALPGQPPRAPLRDGDGMRDAGAQTPMIAAGARTSAVMGGTCRYCSGSLPSGRKITYCPHCGQNLTVQRCPACSTELELGWSFCTTCGRQVSAS